MNHALKPLAEKYNLVTESSIGDRYRAAVQQKTANSSTAPKKPKSALRGLYPLLLVNNELITDLNKAKSIAKAFIADKINVPEDIKEMTANIEHIGDIGHFYKYLCNSLLCFERKPNFYRPSHNPLQHFKNICTDQVDILKEQEMDSADYVTAIEQILENNNISGVAVQTRHGDQRLSIMEIWNNNGILTISVGEPTSVEEMTDGVSDATGFRASDEDVPDGPL